MARLFRARGEDGVEASRVWLRSALTFAALALACGCGQHNREEATGGDDTPPKAHAMLDFIQALRDRNAPVGRVINASYYASIAPDPLGTWWTGNLLPTNASARCHYDIVYSKRTIASAELAVVVEVLTMPKGADESCKSRMYRIVWSDGAWVDPARAVNAAATDRALSGKRLNMP